MPFIRLDTTEEMTPDSKASLCAKLSKICAETIGKAEEYQMAVVHDALTIQRSGRAGPAAFVEIRSIGGLTPSVNRSLSEKVCGLLLESLKIPGERVYLNMLDVRGGDWGHDGTTFAGL
jgi:phenylpyruvate tautomerase PptA (4-oxalocrotonate tautomerase family)